MTQLENTVVCPSCHAKLTGNPMYCMRCGAKVGYQAAVPEVPSQKVMPAQNPKRSLKPSLSINNLPIVRSSANSVDAATIDASSNTHSKYDYWEPEKMKAFIFSIAAAIGIFLTALGLWVTTSIDATEATFYLARLQMLKFMLFGVLIVVGSLFFMTLMEVRGKA
ncbi:MAG: hypothetical protein QXX17_04580 [Conexivisphaerales archaeon]